MIGDDDFTEAAFAIRWARLAEETGIRREDLGPGRFAFVAGDGRRLEEIDLYTRPTMDLVGWAGAHLRILAMPVLDAVTADEGEG